MGSNPPDKTKPPPQASPPPTPPAASSSPPPPSSPPPNPLSPPPASNPPPKNPLSPPPASPPPPASNTPASPPPPAQTKQPDNSPPPPSSTSQSDPSSKPPPEIPKNAPPTPRRPGSPPTPPSPDTPGDSQGPPSPNTSGGLPSPPGTKPGKHSHPPSLSGPQSNSSPLADSGSLPSDSPPSPGTPPILEESQSSPVGTHSEPSSLESTPSHSGSSLVSPQAPATNKPLNAPHTPSSPAVSNELTAGMIALGVVASLIVLGVLGTIAWYLSERKKIVSGPKAGYVMPTSLGSSPQSDAALLKAQVTTANPGSGISHDSVTSPPPEPGGLANSKSWFTYKELSEFTNGFSAQNLLGEGGFGSVYKGCLPDGREVAVKQLKVGGGQGDREFRAEVEIISRIHHRHLVTLVGYCISDKSRLLIYDYVPNNTLHFHLHGEGRPVLGWAARVKIAVGAARGIAYLHEDCHPRIIHRDIKSSNILLDHNFEALVSDFGLAKLFQDNNTHVTTRVVGTFGYMAPEYASSGKLTEKSDVFSFGVVLLELITGRKPVDASQPPGEESLVEWARPLLSRALDTEELDSLVDPRLEKCYVDNEMLLMIEAAAACVRHTSANRPRMPQVVRAFDSISAADLSNGMRVGESEMFNSTDKSSEIKFFRRMAFGGSQDFTISQDSMISEER